MNSTSALPGDWLIRSPEEKTYTDSVDAALAIRTALYGEIAFTDHAVVVLGITRTHLTIYDPIAGRPFILHIASVGGSWRSASPVEVEVTFVLAEQARPGQHVIVKAEREKWPVRQCRGA